jgi:hypothetical protein
MANRKKRKVGIRKLSRVKLIGDLFYFDQGAWETIMARALAKGEGAAVGRQSMERMAKARRTKERNMIRRRAARLATRADPKGAFFEARRGPAWRDRIITALEPGAWFGAVDIARLTGLAVRSVRAILKQKLLPEGLVARGRNPDWVGNTRNVEPERLWSLTPAGELERERVRAPTLAGERVRMVRAIGGRDKEKAGKAWGPAGLSDS